MNVKNKLNELSCRQKNIILFLSIVLFNIVLMIISLYNKQAYFGTVDDSRMRDIASGAMTGEPNGRLIFILYPLGFLISLMYRLIPNVPWYLVFMIGSMIISLSLVLYRCIRNVKALKKIILLIAIYLVMYILYFKQLIIYPQFTTTAAILGSVSIFWYATSEKQVSLPRMIKDISIIISLFMMCYLYRYKVAEMMVPLLVIIFLVKNYGEFKKKETKIYNISIGGILLFLVIISRFIDNFMYSTVEYKEYRDFNRARSYINDYYKMPDYYENIDLYNEAEISYEQYSAITKYSILLVEDIPIESLNKIIEFQKNKIFNDPIESIKRTIVNYISTYDGFVTFKWQPFFLLIMTAILLIYFIFNRKIKLLLYLGATIAMAICGSFYFIYTLRFPQRLAESVWLSNAIFVIYCLSTVLCEMNMDYSEFKEKFKNYSIKKKSILLLTVFMSVGIGIYSCIRNGRGLTTRYELTNMGSVDYVYMMDYARKNKDNFYYYYVYSFSEASDTFGIENETELLSWTSLGGWLTRSPLLNEKYERYGFESTEDALLNHDNVYIAATEVPQFLVEYFGTVYPEYELVVSEEVNNGRILLLSLKKR